MAEVRVLRISTLSEIAGIRAVLQELGERLALSPERIYDMQVATSEASANAIEHGIGCAQIYVWDLCSHVLVDVSSVGPFTPRLPSTGDRDRGFGLGLMVSLADKVEMSGDGQWKTTTKLWFKIDQQPVVN